MKTKLNEYRAKQRETKNFFYSSSHLSIIAIAWSTNLPVNTSGFHAITCIASYCKTSQINLVDTWLFSLHVFLEETIFCSCRLELVKGGLSENHLCTGMSQHPSKHPAFFRTLGCFCMKINIYFLHHHRKEYDHDSDLNLVIIKKKCMNRTWSSVGQKFEARLWSWYWFSPSSSS